MPSFSIRPTQFKPSPTNPEWDQHPVLIEFRMNQISSDRVSKPNHINVHPSAVPNPEINSTGKADLQQALLVKRWNGMKQTDKALLICTTWCYPSITTLQAKSAPAD